jgi:hypothetical protein
METKPLPDVLLIAEDDLRRRLREMSPQLHAYTLPMAELIRELVKIERAKAGHDKPGGTLELVPNKDKKRPTDPELTGYGTITGRHYRAAAWFSGNGDKLKISLLPSRLPPQ